jgi:hypothetical protein
LIQASAKRNFAAAKRLVKHLSARMAGFTIQHQSQPFIAAEIGGIVLLGPIAGRRQPFPSDQGERAQTERMHLVECRVCQHREFPFVH